MNDHAPHDGSDQARGDGLAAMAILVITVVLIVVVVVTLVR